MVMPPPPKPWEDYDPELGPPPPPAWSPAAVAIGLGFYAIVGAVGAIWALWTFGPALVTLLGPTIGRPTAIIGGAIIAAALFYQIKRRPNQALWGLLEMAGGVAGIIVAALWEHREPGQWVALGLSVMIFVQGLHQWRVSSAREGVSR